MARGNGLNKSYVILFFAFVFLYLNPFSYGKIEVRELYCDKFKCNLFDIFFLVLLRRHHGLVITGLPLEVHGRLSSYAGR